jgi:hypothetical protein
LAEGKSEEDEKYILIQVQTRLQLGSIAAQNPALMLDWLAVAAKIILEAGTKTEKKYATNGFG